MPVLDLVIIDKARFEDAISMYFLWKELDSRIRNSASRGINFPETISEVLACYVLNYDWNKGSSGDAISKGKEIIEMKATSNWERDTTSFSPKEEFDRLIFIRLDKKEDKLYFYDLGYNSEKLKKIKVNVKETLEDQQLAKRRPRFSIIKFIINQEKISPIAMLDLRTKQIKTF